MGNVRL
jgi:hypothetical protein